MKINIFKLSILAFSIFSISNCNANAISADTKNFIIDNLIDRQFIPMNKIPGVGLTIVENGEIFKTQGYGKSDLETGALMDNNTTFLIASVTKTFTATMIVKNLNEKFPELGKAVMDTPIHKLINASTIFSDRFRSESMSFRDLLTHRACLEPMDHGILFGVYASPAEIVNRTKYAREFQCAFRESAVYSNALFSLAGELIAKIAGSTYESLMKQLFAQLKMTNTNLIQSTIDYDTVENMARAYYYRNGQPNRLNSELYKRGLPMLPAGGILTNANDMAQYLKFRLSNGKVDGVQIVPEATMKWMEEASAVFPFNGYKTSSNNVINGNFALGSGILLGIYDGWQVQTHDGGFAVFRCLMSLYPDLNTGIFTITNGPGSLDSFFDHKVLHETIFDILRDLSPRDLHAKVKTKVNGFESKDISAINLNEILKKLKAEIPKEEMVGSFGNPVHGEFRITLNQTVNALYLQYGKWGTGFLLLQNNETNLYLLELDSDVVGDFISFIPNQEILPEFFFQFVDINKIHFISNGISLEFIRNANMETYPPQLWDPNSCGPDGN